jgi:hypothetical protein
VEQEFTTLGTQMELERGMNKEIVKNAVGRPKKALEAILTKTVVPQACSSKKFRGSYTNWIVSFPLGAYCVAVVKLRCLSSALHYLQLKYKLLGKKANIYDHLSRGSYPKQFTSVGEQTKSKPFSKTP